jgi:hypothetical protein
MEDDLGEMEDDLGAIEDGLVTENMPRCQISNWAAPYR